PVPQRDHADDLQAGVVERLPQFGELPALAQIRGNLFIPGLDRLIPRPARDPDLLQEGGRLDRARVQAVGEFGHKASPRFFELSVISRQLSVVSYQSSVISSDSPY